MGFLDFVNDAGLSTLDSWTRTRSYIVGYGPSQADVSCFKAIKSPPDVTKYPHAYRWYKHVTSYESEFSSLPGDPSKGYDAYGPETSGVTINPKNAPDTAAAEEEGKEEEEDDDDLFGSDDESEDEEAKKIKEANLAAYKKKKEGKPKPAAKSIVTLEVKPWDDGTDMALLEANMRTIEMDGLVWGASKLVPVGYGINKLQVNVVVEDQKVSIDDLQARIEGDEDQVQSTDVAAMQKL
ncbi:MAG: hypothetical protein Q9163_005235 [Psora crenata]